MLRQVQFLQEKTFSMQCEVQLRNSLVRLAAERFAKTAMVCCFNGIVHISQKAKRIAKVATLRRGVSLVAGTASNKKNVRFCVNGGFLSTFLLYFSNKNNFVGTICL